MAKNDKALTVAPVAAALGLVQDVKPMTAKDAVLILENAIVACAFLEGKAQGSVNRDVDSQIIVRQNGENANGKDIAASFKSQAKMSKTMRGLTESIRFGKLVASVEEKPIDTTATKDETPKLSQDTPK